MLLEMLSMKLYISNRTALLQNALKMVNAFKVFCQYQTLPSKNLTRLRFKLLGSKFSVSINVGKQVSHKQ